MELSLHLSPRPPSERHRPFIRAFNGARRDSLRWQRIRAGLLALEFIEDQWSGHRRGSPAEVYSPIAVRHAIGCARPKRIRVLLERLIDCTLDGTSAKPVALDALDAYAKQLADDCEFELAAHVYLVIIQGATESSCGEQLRSAYMRRGSCLREVPDDIGALESYRVGAELAAESQDEQIAIRIDIDRSNLFRTRNRLTEARGVLTSALRRARSIAKDELIGRAAHERGIVLFELGKPVEALVDYREAFSTLVDLDHKHRLLNDIGRSLESLGLNEAARDAWLVVDTAIKGKPYAQSAARINLMGNARATGDHKLFNQLRLRPQTSHPRSRMPPRLLAAYHFEVGEGLAKFGHESDAYDAYERSAQIAERKGLDEELRQAREALNGRKRWQEEAKRIPVTDFPASVTELIDAIRELRSSSQMGKRSSRQQCTARSRSHLQTTLRRGRRPRFDSAE
jgi:tetratricopeptide (TPR) repeat protein